MDTKTSKILSSIAAVIIFIAFFIPWTKSMFGLSVSAWDLVKQLFTMFSNANKIPTDIRVYLPFILIAIPICSGIIIFNNAKTLNDLTDKTKNSKIITIIVFILVIFALIYAQMKNPFSDFSNIFEILGFGFYLTFIGVVYYLVDILTVKTKTQQNNNSSEQTELFCSNCGKKYNQNNVGEFCEECGKNL